MATNKVPSESSFSNLSKTVAENLKKKQLSASSKGNQKSDSKANSKNNRKSVYGNDSDRSDPKGKTVDRKQPIKKEQPHKYEDLVKDVGGSADDLKLLESVDSGSDSEMEIGGPVNDRSFGGELDDFMSSLGFEADKKPGNRKNEITHSKTAQKAENKAGNVAKKTDKVENKPERSEEGAGTKKAEITPKTDREALKAQQRAEKKKARKLQREERKNGSNVEPEASIEDQLLGGGKVQARSDWYNIKLPSYHAPSPDAEILPEYKVTELYNKAKSLLESTNKEFSHESNSSNSQKQFISNLLTAGTLSDKISAYTLLVQESPLHSMQYFDALATLARKKARSNAIQVVAALKDLFVGGVLPDRKLKYFKNQPLSERVPDEYLILWAFEDWLKTYFFSFLELLEVLSHDTVPFIRLSAVGYIFDLLRTKPEQEANVLRLGVNKLGDSDKKVASKASYMLLQIEQVHPSMKSIVTNAISELIFRHQADHHARYYSVVTLNQTILTARDRETANKLMNVYLVLFEQLLAESNARKKATEEPPAKAKKPRWKNKESRGKNGGIRVKAKTADVVKEEEEQKLISATLTGLNRAYPFSKMSKDVLGQHVDTLYKITHSANFNTSVQALILLFQISKNNSSLKDRFLRTLYESLLDTRLSSSSKQRLYLNLIYNSLREDKNEERLKAFIKRMVQIADHWVEVGPVTAIIYLIEELKKQNKGLKELLVSADNSKKEKNSADEYDGRKRDPLFANAGNSRLWEVYPLLNHYHPTVVVYAEGFFHTNTRLTKPDMTLHSLTHFLDKFIYRNPKQNAGSKGNSIMQPLAGSDTSGTLFSISDRRQDMPVNAIDWKNRSADQVDPSEKFFYEYFKNKKDDLKKSKRDAEDYEDVDNELVDEDNIWSSLVASRPDIVDASEGDSDDEMDSDTLKALNDQFDDEDDMDEGDSEEDGESLIDSELEREMEKELGGLGNDEVEGEDDDESAEDLEDNAVDEDELELDIEDADAELDSDDELAAKKRPLGGHNSSNTKTKRRRLKDLPTFASADDYAKLLDDDEE